MESEEDLRERTEHRWKELTAELHANRELLADRFMQQIDDGRRYYESRVGARELRATALSAFERLLRELSGQPTTQEDRDFARRVGARRARQGVESEKLIAAVHRDFGALWSALIALAAEDDALTLAAHAEDVWRVVDNFAGQIHAAYVDEWVALAHERSMSRQSLVAQLMSDDRPSPTFLARISQALSIGDNDGIWVAAAVVNEDAALQQFSESLRRRGRTAYNVVVGGCLVAMWIASRSDNRELTQNPAGWMLSVESAELRSVRCGIATMQLGLGEVHAAVACAREIAMAMPRNHRGPATMSTVWPLLAGAGLNDRMPGFQQNLLAGLATCREAERTALLETVKAYARSGDISATASIMFCHRNTVMKRLSRFRDMVGLDLTIPNQAAQAIVALAQSEFR